MTNAPRSQGTFQLSPGHPNIPGYHAVANIKPVNASSDDFTVNPCNLARAGCSMSGDARTKYELGRTIYNLVILTYSTCM